MQRRRQALLLMSLFLLVLASPLLAQVAEPLHDLAAPMVLEVEAGSLTSSSTPEAVKKAIEKSLKNPEQAEKTVKAIQPGATPGLFGIPGAVSPSVVIGFFWAIWVGWIFSTVGAFGGVMAGVGHITVLGMGDYAKEFGKGHPLNKLITDAIRVSNEWLVGLSAIISSLSYYKMKRLVMPLGVSLAVGSVAGAYMVPVLSAGKINLKDYIGYFGLVVLVLGCYLFYQTTERGMAGQKQAKAAAAAFEKQRARTAEGRSTPVETLRLLEGSMGYMYVALALVLSGALWGNIDKGFFPGSIYIAYALIVAGLGLVFAMPQKTIRFEFFGVEFSFKSYIPMIGGFLIASIAAFLGVGGGFLLVPFLTSIAGLPMFLAAGTSALAVLVSMVVSTFTYMVGEAVIIPWTLVGVELVGIFIGSLIGPYTQKYIPYIWLKRLFVVLALYVGIQYVSKGFLGYSILPPR